MIQKEYTAQEWTVREDYYRDQLMQLTIPMFPDGNMLQAYINLLDSVMNEAFIDKAYIYQAYEYYIGMQKLYEKELFSDVRDDEIAKGNKPTEKYVDGLVAKKIKTIPLPNMGMPIMDITSILLSRKLYIDSVIMLIKEKIAMIPTANTILSSETKVSLANVPSNINKKN